MSEKKRRPSNSSRTVAIAAVVLLIVVAIAGVVLAGRSSAPAVDGTVGSTAPSSATPPAASAPTAPINPNEVVFAAGSEKLPPSATDSLARFAEAARSNGGGIRLSTRFLTGANKARDLELARARTEAIRKALKDSGVKTEKMQVELVEMPAGSLSEADANRVDLSLR